MIIFYYVRAERPDYLVKKGSDYNNALIKAEETLRAFGAKRYQELSEEEKAALEPLEK